MSGGMRVSLLAAFAEDGVMGHEGRLPWRLPDELAHVKALTTGHCILMGRKTWESIGRPLPKRTNIVLTHDSGYRAEGAHVVHAFEAGVAFARERGESELFVFGGAQVYELALAIADRMYLTRVHAELEGDVRFPDFDETQWKLADEECHEADSRHPHAFTLQRYERR